MHNSNCELVRICKISGAYSCLECGITEIIFYENEEMFPCLMREVWLNCRCERS